MRKNPTIIIIVILLAGLLTCAGISLKTSGNTDKKVSVVSTRADPSVSVNLQGEVDLATDTQLFVYGAQGDSPVGESLGGAMAVGDINGDGENDLLVSALLAPIDKNTFPHTMGPGEVYVFYGRDRASFNDEIDLSVDVPDLLIRGNESEDKFGHALAIANVNGDAFDDIIIGAPERGIPSTPPPIWYSRDNIGSVYIIFGDTKANLGTYRNMTKETDFDVIIQGDVEGEMIGYNVDTGDLDNDGMDDLVIAGPGMNRSFDKVGGIYILYGKSTWPPLIECNWTWDDPDSQAKYKPHYDKKVQGKDQADNLGYGLDVGDINDDGYHDIVVGAPQGDGWDDLLDAAGEVYVICGNDEWNWKLNSTIEEMANMTLYSRGPFDNYGKEISVGNVDNDAFEDILMGAPGGDGWQDSQTDCGDAYLLWGNSYISNGLGVVGTANPKQYSFNISNKADVRFTGQKGGDEMGSRVLLGDLDMDGHSEILLGAPKADGRGDQAMDCGETYLIWGGEKLDITPLFTMNNVTPDCIIYGKKSTDLCPSYLAMGDLDNDGANDLFLSSVMGEPTPTRKNSGEMYGLFGSPFRIGTLDLIDGYDKLTFTDGGGKTCFAGLKHYTFRLNIYDSKGIDDLDRVGISLNPKDKNFTIHWVQSSGQFLVVNNTGTQIDLDLVGSTATIAGNHLQLDLKIMFNWNYHVESIQNVKVWALNDSGMSMYLTHLGIYDVENDLAFQGLLKAESTVFSDVSVNASWCPSKGKVNWTGLKVVYEGSQNIHPPNDAFYVSIKSQGNEWRDYDTSGYDFSITTDPPNGTTDPWGDHYSIDIDGLLGTALDKSNVWMYLRADKTPPDKPSNLKVMPDSFQDDPLDFDNDNEIYVDWDEVTDMTNEAGTQPGMGIKAYYYSLEDNGGTTDGSLARESGGLVGYYYDSFNFYDAKIIQVDPNIDFDWGSWSPDNNQVIPQDLFTARWVGWLYANQTTSYTLYVDSDDGAEIWLDGKVIYDEWKPTHPMQINLFLDQGFHELRIDYGDESGEASITMEWAYGTTPREVIPKHNLFHPATEGIITNAAGGLNTVYVWAEDLLGNIGQAINTTIFIDTANATFGNPIMKEAQWYVKDEITVGISVSDAGAGVDVASLQYRTSSSGISGYIDWKDVPVGSVASNPLDAKGYNISFNETLLDGSDNYLQFRAMDIVGNGYEMSKDYNLWVDTEGVEVTLYSPVPAGKYYEREIYLNVSVYDRAGSGVDPTTIAYRTSTNGTTGLGDWVEMNPLNVTFSASNRLAKFNISLTFPYGNQNMVQVRAGDVAGNPLNTTMPFLFSVFEIVENDPPLPVISHPLNGLTVTEGDPVLFDGSNSTDPEGDTITFYWESSWNNGLGHEAKFVYTRPLHLNEHTITLWVDDGNSNISASVLLFVEEGESTGGVVNPPPDPANDTDGDEMHDQWELEHFGGLDKSDGKGDADGDRYSDLLEYQYDTDPNNSDDFPEHVEPDISKSETETNWALIFAVILGILVLIIIAIVIFFLYKRQKRVEEVSADNVMMVRQKTKSDQEYDKKLDDEQEGARKEDEILRKTRGELEEEAEGLYADTDWDEEDWDEEDLDEEELDEEYEDDEE
jgi:hypothetical protein